MVYITSNIQPEDVHQKKMLEHKETLVAVEEDRATDRQGISIDVLNHRLGAVLSEV